MELVIKCSSCGNIFEIHLGFLDIFRQRAGPVTTCPKCGKKGFNSIQRSVTRGGKTREY
ncbi:MAG: hypothetical protein M1393_05125 [Candidatus Thermoplasmatota archaeon]|nr:hypothetical protein [Candidatus Thermoplasmatota archaeon]MCL6090404.1 hypothetical protein [Candidatus Thermoplasmatota archaeon]MDA8143118.1 hypothetical protein [Thermoplasmatales archaeon]